MTEESRKAFNEYQKKWRKKHPEKTREYQERYWKRKFEAQKNK